MRSKHKLLIGLAFWRDLLGCVTLLMFTLLSHPKNLRIDKKDLPWIIGMGAGLGSFHIFYNQSIIINGAAITTVQQAAMPLDSALPASCFCPCSHLCPSPFP